MSFTDRALLARLRAADRAHEQLIREHGAAAFPAAPYGGWTVGPTLPVPVLREAA